MKKWFTSIYWLEKLPLHKAFLWILSFTFVVSGSACLCIIYYKHLQEVRTHDSKYAITTIVQHCQSGNELPTAYLAELLSLSADRPFHLYKWDAVEAEKSLCNSPYIKKAFIAKQPPETIRITYTARTPIAAVGDISNALIDRDGHLLPEHMFFSKATFPKLILGLDKVKWGAKLTAPEVKLAMQVKELVDQEFPKANLSVIDVSRAYARSAGKRQIIVILKPEDKTHILRLTSQNFPQQLANYRTLAESGKLSDYTSISIDLRLDHLAYLHPVETQGEENEGIH